MKTARRFSRFAASASAAVALALLAAAPAAAQQQPPRPAARPPAAADTARPARQVAPLSPAADSLLRRLRELPGFTPVEYQGDSATFQGGELRLQGQAQVERQGDRLTADRIIYQQQARLVHAAGNPTVTGQAASEIQGDSLVYDFERRRATVLNGKTTFTQNATWLVQGNVTAEGQSRFYTTTGCFTTDDRFGACAFPDTAAQQPQYHFEADRILMVKDKIIVARPARLYFRNVPVFWLPFIVQNLERGRRSGILVPELRLNDIVQTSSGQTREISNIGFYWAVNQYMNAQISGGWRSGTYKQMTGVVDYLVRRQFLQGNFGFRQYWRDLGGTEFSLNANNQWQPTERTNLGMSATYATSSDFVRRTTVEPGEATQNLRSSFNLTHRFDWGNVALGADRQQSISNGSVSMTLPSFSLSPNPITLFRSSAADPSWYHNGSFTVRARGSRALSQAGDPLQNQRPGRDEHRFEFSSGQDLQFGGLSISSTQALNSNTLGGLPAFDSVSGGTAPALQERTADRGNWTLNTSYSIPLIGNTRVSPSLSFGQEFRRDSLVLVDTVRVDGEPVVNREVQYEQFVTSPMRMSFGASLSPELYGFFPGVGPFTAIRHRLSPTIGYSYSPAPQPDRRQRAIFGPGAGRTQNAVTLSLNQSFEAKLRAPTEPDTATADTAAGGEPRRRPMDARKVTILSLQTSAIAYDFERASRGLSGLTTTTLNNTIDSDYLRGLRLQFSHDLFDRSGVTNQEDNGRFSPFLTGVSTGFQLGPGSGILRFLGIGRERESLAAANEGVIPGQAPQQNLLSGGSTSFTGNQRAVGGGTWNASIDYVLVRQRPLRTTGEGSPLSTRGLETQNIQANLSFPLTPNWGLNWSTNYSVTDGRFGNHRLSLVRDLYRWQANFNFTRTESGNTSFDFSVRLIDLPDLKFDYRENNIGADDRSGF